MQKVQIIIEPLVCDHQEFSRSKFKIVIELLYCIRVCDKLKYCFEFDILLLMSDMEPMLVFLFETTISTS